MTDDQKALGTSRQQTVDAAEAAGVERAATGDVGLRERVLMHPQFLLITTLVVFSAYVTSQSPAFLDLNNWTNIFRNAVFIFIVGAFSTYVLVSGGLDLSVGSVFLVGAIAVANLLYAGFPIWVSVMLAVGLGAFAGLVNGVFITYVRIPAFIATLGMLYVARGLATFVTGGKPIAPLPSEFSSIGQGDIFGIPFLVIYALIVGVVAHFVMEITPFGWSIRALGGNAEAARAAGIDTRRLAVTVYVLSGASAAFAGLLMSARLGSGQPSVGNGFELQVISAVIIGGTSMFGGIGTVFGTALGALVLSTLSNGLILLRIDPILQNVMVGCIIIAAVALDQFRRGRMFRALRR
jgi:ribose/xylose/arabinose/galactoside ABC-type transport system permease subunit